MTLDELAIKHGTDKSSQEHDYCRYYEELLPKKPSRLLEIGCMHGNSLRMWREFFPKAEIATADLFQNPEFASYDHIKSEGFTTYKIDQGYVQELAMIDGEFDVIIDDGSHRSDHQLISIEYLFPNRLKSGGVYIVEDLHCCKELFFRNGLSFRRTLLGKAMEHKIHGLLEDVDHYKLINDNILFIWKK